MNADECGFPMLAEGVRVDNDKESCNQLRSEGSMSETVFEGRTRSGAESLAIAQATLIGAHKLLERARTGNPYEADSNVRCAVAWLRDAIDDLDALLKAKG